MALAGLVLDHTPDLIDAIISGDVALSDAADQAAAIRDAHKFEQERERLRTHQLVEPAVNHGRHDPTNAP